MATAPASRRLASVFALAAIVAAVTSHAAPQEADARIAAIRTLYASVQSRIELALKKTAGGDGGGLYSTDLVVNSQNGSWRAVGTYARKTRFWFTDQPEFARREGRTEASVLVKVEVDDQVAARTARREFLFDDGRLVFAFVRDDGADGRPVERRFYFDQGKAFRYLEGPVPAPVPEEAAVVLREAAALQAQFLATFDPR